MVFFHVSVFITNPLWWLAMMTRPLIGICCVKFYSLNQKLLCFCYQLLVPHYSFLLRYYVGTHLFPDVLLNDIAGPDGNPLLLSLKLSVDVLVSHGALMIRSRILSASNLYLLHVSINRLQFIQDSTNCFAEIF